MDELKANEVAVNLELMKWYGFYKMFRPDGKTVFNRNIYRLSFVVFIVFVQCLIAFGTVRFFVEMKDATGVTDIVMYLDVVLYNYLYLWKTLVLLYKADVVWDVLNVTRLNFMTSQRCREHVWIIYECRDSVKKITNVYFCFTLVICCQWLTYPLVIDMFTTSEHADRRRQNIIDIPYPIDTDSYNRYYVVFYTLELMVLIFIGYGSIIVDSYVISLYWIITAQYEILIRAFEDVGHEERSQIDDYEDFKSILFDQQQLYSNVKSYYSVAKPIILTHVILNAVSLILVTFSFIWTCTSVETISITNTSKLGQTAFFDFMQLIIYCYMFGNINTIRESVNFGIYFCNWTKMNLKFKKLLLLAMRMNDTDRLAIKASPKKIIDLKLFTNVIMTCYNILSVMLKTVGNKNQ